jgi:hypothetical protein
MKPVAQANFAYRRRHLSRAFGRCGGIIGVAAHSFILSRGTKKAAYLAAFLFITPILRVSKPEIKHAKYL